MSDLAKILHCVVSSANFFGIYPTGLAAPAIAAGFTALVPTLHTLVPLIGASGFAAIATAAGHTAGSVAVAASFGGESDEMLPGLFLGLPLWRHFSSFHIMV
jgi:acyl-CoA reductase-like NAD-dependent aldehyde dehydrogenase